jgi:prenylcysteine oxidase / farnesylcysteine lyase
MVKASQATFNGNTQVSSISIAEGSDPETPQYILSTQDTASTKDAEDYPVAFDNIVLAAPWQFSNISTTKSVLTHRIDSILYTKLHVTLFASPFKLRPGFFGLDAGARAPSSVYTTLGADEEPRVGADGVGRTGYYSVSTIRTVVNPVTLKREYVYKIFSAEPVTREFLVDLLGVDVPKSIVSQHADEEGREEEDVSEEKKTTVEAISWYYPHWFYSYPIELPRITFQDPVVGNGVYYTGGIESFISTMETSALMGKNVARLIADEFAGIVREASQEAEGPGYEGEKADPLADEEL